jgi:hypothetical protein
MDNQERVYRVVTFLGRDDLDFLDGMIKDAYFAYGIKIPRAKLIENIIDGCKEQKDVKQIIQAQIQEKLQEKKGSQGS